MRTHLHILLRMSARAPANLSLPRELVEQVDAVAGPRNRSAFVEAAIRDRLRRERLRAAIRSTAGAWSAEDQFSTGEDVVEWVRRSRAETTASGPESGR